MHPILEDRRRLGTYLTAWAPIGLFLVAGLRQDSTWAAAAALFLPITFVYAFVCLSSWYICRAYPVDRGDRIWHAAAVHTVAAAMLSGVWVTLGDGWAASLHSLAPNLDVVTLQAAQRSRLFVVGVLLFWLVAVLLYLLLAFEASREAETRALELTILAREAELKALRAQIDPHFLYNSLNSISALTATDPGAARRMCLLLADFLRATLSLGSNSRIPLSAEFDLAERFLAIERVRLGPRLIFVRDNDAASNDCLVPPLLIQPLVENAVVHGIAHLLEGGTIRLSASRGGSTLTIALENPCDPDRPRRRDTGLGLELLRKRVSTQFGTEGAVNIEEEPERFRVEVRIPVVTAA